MPQSTRLWGDREFVKLWAGETVSLFGSHVTATAVPLTAAVALHATPAQMGLLSAAQYAPFLLVTLLAGIWVDRRRRRPVLVVSNFARAVLIGLIPLAAVLGVLRMELLIVVVFLAGIFTVFFHLAYLSYLPVLIPPEHLVEGNSKLEVSSSTASIAGPGLAGMLVEVASGPVALALDALSFVFAGICMMRIRRPEPAPAPTTQATPAQLWAEVREGVRFTVGNRYLQAVAGEAATYNLFWTGMEGIVVLYIVRELGMGAGIVGILYMVGSVGALVGAAATERAGRRFGTGRTILGAMAMACTAPLLVPLVRPGTPEVLAFATLGTAYFVGWTGVAAYNVHVISLRQVITPDRLRGRMNASYRLITWGTIPIGSLAAGALAGEIGLRTTVLVGAVGVATAWLWVLFSPVPRVPDLLSVADEGARWQAAPAAEAAPA